MYKQNIYLLAKTKYFFYQLNMLTQNMANINIAWTFFKLSGVINTARETIYKGSGSIRSP